MSTVSDIIALKEITAWDDLGYKVPNHIYFLNKAGHCVGYRKTGGGEVTMFSQPMKRFEKTRRKFIQLNPAEKYMTARV